MFLLLIMCVMTCRREACGKVPLWSSCDSVTLDYYSQYLDSLLFNISVPFSALGSCSSDLDCVALIDQFYVDIFHASLMLLCSAFHAECNLTMSFMFQVGLRLLKKNMMLLGRQT